MLSRTGTTDNLTVGACVMVFIILKVFLSATWYEPKARLQCRSVYELLPKARLGLKKDLDVWAQDGRPRRQRQWNNKTNCRTQKEHVNM